ncbi:MAG: YihY/virulence factor BrkB family protein [Cytophagales bacterium]|nr:YihY/virulence factor BrkB family protein [Cytophagales bacterium]
MTWWEKIRDRILESVYYRIIVSFLDRIIVSKRGNVSLWNLLVQFKNELYNNDLLSESKAVAYNFTVAMFPAIIFLFTLIPHIPIENLDVEIMKFLHDFLPPSMYDVTSSTINDIVSKQRGGLLSFSFIIALTLATNGMQGLMDAFNKCYQTNEKRTYLKKRLIATLLTILLSLVLFIAMFVLIFGEAIIKGLTSFEIIQMIGFDHFAFDLLRYLVFALISFFAISIIYYWAPAVHRRWNFLSLGSVVATILSIGFSIGFSYYINNFSSYNRLYGSIGTLLGIMLWLQFISFVLLVGFEINASIDLAEEKKEKKS